MSLFDKYGELEPNEWKYYNAQCYNDKVDVLNKFDANNCKKFITQYFKLGNKEKAFDISFCKEYLNNGKHEHTVSLYFLGCFLREIIDVNLKQHISVYIPKIDDWYDFRYTWFLTCLYHDVASAIEKDEWKCGCPADLYYYLGKYDIQYNVYQHSWDNPHIKSYTYAENLVKNYFRYRVDYCHSIDHGIIAGYLLYDRLVKNYNEAWKQYANKPDAQSNNANSFQYNNLTWCKEQISHFAFIADAIIAHNIWLSDNTNVELYRQYGLNSLISDPPDTQPQKLTLKNNPLVFFLDLLDTMEPVKFFKCVQPNEVLKQIDIDKKENQPAIVISIDTSFPKADVWCSKVEKVKDWLDVTVQTQKNPYFNKDTITISFK